MIQGHFEAQKHAFRQTRNGTIVSFLLHPNDISPNFSAADLGTRFQIGYAEILDDNELPDNAQEGSVIPPITSQGESGGGAHGNDLLNAAPADEFPDYRV